jgi:hypothetical protein
VALMGGTARAARLRVATDHHRDYRSRQLLANDQNTVGACARTDWLSGPGLPSRLHRSRFNERQARIAAGHFFFADRGDPARMGWGSLRHDGDDASAREVLAALVPEDLCASSALIAAKPNTWRLVVGPWGMLVTSLRAQPSSP